MLPANNIVSVPRKALLETLRCGDEAAEHSMLSRPDWWKTV